MNKGNRILCAWLQLMLLLFTLFPRDVAHELFGCKDTHHCETKDIIADKILSAEHHHCRLLQLDSPLPYIPAQNTVLSSREFIVETFEIYNSIVSDVAFITGTSRAPPVI